jgi:hypothetical protein
MKIDRPTIPMITHAARPIFLLVLLAGGLAGCNSLPVTEPVPPPATSTIDHTEITLYAFQPTAAAAVEALNARPEREKYVLSAIPLPSRFAIPRWRKPLKLAQFPPNEPVRRASVALVVDGTGAVVDAAAFNFNDSGFANAMVHDIPKMIMWVSNKANKNERALIVLTFNTRSEDPEEFIIGPVTGP